MRAATHRCRASARWPSHAQAGDLKAAAGAANAQWPRLAPRDMTAVRGSIGSSGSNGSNGSSLSAAGHGGGLDALPRPCGAQATANYSRRKRDGDPHRHPRPACVHPASALRMRVDGVDARPIGPMANPHEANHSSSVPPIALATIALRIPDTGYRIPGTWRLASAIVAETVSLTCIKTWLIGGRARRVREWCPAPGRIQPT